MGAKPGLTAKADQTLMLAVVVNGHPTNKIGEFVLRDGALFARPEELRDLGFRVTDAVPVSDQRLTALVNLPNLACRLDQATQTLYVTADDSALSPTLLEVGRSAIGNYAVESGIGTTLNYDAIATSVGNRLFGTGSFDLRGFSPWGVASSGLLAYAGVNSAGTRADPMVRLDSTYVYSDPESMRRYRIGDFISGFLPWTRSVRLGGAQVNSDFSMRPDLITFPVPSASGSVAVPSTLDVLVNGSRVLSQQVQPGPFQVTQLPVITGAGTVSLAVTDALGKQVTTELPFYATPTLLAPGLQTYSLEAGLVRHNWGVISNDYGRPAGAATYRRGLSNDLTLEGHAETSRGLFMAGGGGVVNVDNLVVVNLAAAGSSGLGHAGAQLAAGVQHIDQRFSLGASAIVATHNFGDIAAANSDPIVQLQLNANAGVSLGRFGSLGIAYAGIDRAAAPPPVPFIAPPALILAQAPTQFGNAFFQPAQHSHILAATYSAQIGNLSFYATTFHDFSHARSDGVFVGLTIPLGSRSSATTAAQSASGVKTGQVQLTQTANTIGDWGYNVLGAVNHPDHEFAQASYKSPWAMVLAGADRLGNRTTLQAEAQGALSFTDSSLLASNRIDDSFAVVDTNGIEGILVKQENRDVERTDSSGRVLVPDLRSFQINHLSIDPLDAPMDAMVPFTMREVRPQDRSGVVVRFPIKTTRGALLRLTDQAGRPIPVGSAATLRSTGIPAPVGYGGEAYLVDLQPHNQVIVEKPDGRSCALSFDYEYAPGTIPTIGPLFCRDAKP